MPMNFAQDQSGMDGSFASPAQPAQNRGGKSFGGRGGMPMQSTMRDFLNQAPYGGQQSQPMFTGAPTGGGGALGQLANTQPQQIQNPANAQRVAGMLRGAGRMFGRF